MHVKDIMARKVVRIDKDQNINDALKLMSKHNVSRLLVVNQNDEKGRDLVGVVTEKDIALRLGSSRYGNLSPSHLHVSTLMRTDLITVKSTNNVGNAAKIMLDNKISGAPVMDDGEITGIVTKTDFMKLCKAESFQDAYISDRMQDDLIIVSPQDRLVHARRLIIDEDIGRLPVVEDKMLEGIITAKDIAKSMISFRKVVPDAYKPARIRNLIVEDVMTQNVRTMKGDNVISEAASLMLENNFSGVPIVDDDNVLTGIITKTDIINIIAEQEGAK